MGYLAGVLQRHGLEGNGSNGHRETRNRPAFCREGSRRHKLRRCLSRKRFVLWFVSRRWPLRCYAREVEKCACGRSTTGSP